MNVGQDNQPTYNTFAAAVVTVNSSAAALTNFGGGLVYLKADPSNGGVIALGGDNTVSTSTGYTLAAGAVSPPIVIDNTSKIFAVAAADGYKLQVLIQK